MASASYPSVLLLDNRNNPITPLVDVDSIYTDVQTKKPVSVVCDTSTDYIDSVGRFEVRGDNDKPDLFIKIKDSSQNEIVSGRPVAILTDVSIGQEIEGYPSHVLNFQKIDLNKLLTKWYEDIYLHNQLGYEIWYGTSVSKPNGYSVDTSKNEVTLTFENEPSVVLNENNLNHMIDGQPYPNKMYRINDFSSTNFFSTDDSDFPRRGKVRPSGEYIWFIILVSDGKGVKPETLHFYGASGEDSPQEIVFETVKNSGVVKIGYSASTFGIDEGLNSNDVYKDGFEYNIYVKYKFANS